MADEPTLPSPVVELAAELWAIAQRKPATDALDVMEDRLTAAIKATRAATLEEAAHACDRIVTAYREFGKDDCAQGAYDAAAAILALIGQ